MCIPSVCLHCTCCLSERTVADLLTLLADRPVSAGLWDLHIGPWCFAVQRAAVDRLPMRVELVKMFSTREEIDGAREAPAWASEGRQKEGRSGFLQATPNRFPGKTYLHTQDSATSYLSELWHVFIEQMDNFLRAFLQKLQPINLRTWALFRLLSDGAADGASSRSRCSFWWALIHRGPKWFLSTCNLQLMSQEIPLSLQTQVDINVKIWRKINRVPDVLEAEAVKSILSEQCDFCSGSHFLFCPHFWRIWTEAVASAHSLTQRL